MSKQLPWATQPTDEPEYAEIGNPKYGVLKIKRLGSLTPNEELAIADYYVGLKNQSMSEAKIDVATILFKYRVDPAWTRADTLACIPSFPLIEDLNKFVEDERSRWVGESYLIKLQGTDAYLAAADYANKIGGLVASRADILGVWFVFADHKSVPLGFVLSDDFAAFNDSLPGLTEVEKK